MGYIQISKVLLEMVSVVIYAFGQRCGPWRRASLGIAMLWSWILFAFMIPLYKPNGISMVIPRMLDTKIAFAFCRKLPISLLLRFLVF